MLKFLIKLITNFYFKKLLNFFFSRFAICWGYEIEAKNFSGIIITKEFYSLRKI